MDREIIFSSDNFIFIMRNGVGVNDTPYRELKILNQGLAEKHVVEVRLDSTHEKFEGEAIQYRYYGAYVAHGMRMKQDSLAETREYIQVLEDAVIFAEKVNAWLDSNEEWQAR